MYLSHVRDILARASSATASLNSNVRVPKWRSPRVSLTWCGLNALWYGELRLNYSNRPQRQRILPIGQLAKCSTWERLNISLMARGLRWCERVWNDNFNTLWRCGAMYRVMVLSALGSYILSVYFLYWEMRGNNAFYFWIVYNHYLTSRYIDQFNAIPHLMNFKTLSYRKGSST